MTRRNRPRSPTSIVAAVLGVALPLCIGANALAQTPLVEELVRKSGAGEQENGFCARTGWPPGDRLGHFTAFLRGASVGSWNVYTFSNGDCVFNSVNEVHQEDGGKCVGYTYYTCAKGGRCGLGNAVDCLDPNGNFKSRRQGYRQNPVRSSMSLPSM